MVIRLKVGYLVSFKKSKKRRYDQGEDEYDSDEGEDDEEDLRNIRSAVRRGERTTLS